MKNFKTQQLKDKFLFLLFSAAILVIFAIVSSLYYTKSNAQEKPKIKETPAEKYQRLLAKYPEYASNQAKIIKQRNIESRKNLVSELLASANKMKGNESELLAMVRNHCKEVKSRGSGKGMIFAGDVEERKILNTASDSCAIVIKKCIDEGIIDNKTILHSYRGGFLSPKWIELYENTENDAEIGKYASKILYRSGIKSDDRRRLLTAQVIKTSDVTFLRPLLFEIDLVSQDEQVIISKENNELVKYLLDKNTNAEIRFDCARYLFYTGNIKKAENICIEIIYRHDIPSDERIKLAKTMDDDFTIYSLERIQPNALLFLYNYISTESSFKVIWDFSRIFDDGKFDYNDPSFTDYDDYERMESLSKSAKSLLKDMDRS